MNLNRITDFLVGTKPATNGQRTRSRMVVRQPSPQIPTRRPKLHASRKGTLATRRRSVHGCPGIDRSTQVLIIRPWARPTLHERCFFWERQHEHHALPLSGDCQHQHHRVYRGSTTFEGAANTDFLPLVLMADLSLHYNQRKEKRKKEVHEKTFPLDIRCCIFSAFFPH